MSMSLRLSDDAVRGSVYSRSEEATEALQRGDVQALIASHRDRFGGWRMEKDDEEDEDSEDDDDAGDGDDDDDEDSDDDSDDEDEDSPEGKKSKKGDAKHDDSPEGLKRKVSALEDEKNRLFRGRKRARQERDDALAELQRVKDSKGGDDELRKENETLTTENQTLKGQVQSARLENAFLSDNTYEWVNPSQALKLADLSDLEIDDDGTVHGLKSALEALATDSPHLLKQRQRKAPAPKEGSSGAAPKKATAKKAAAKRAEIAQKYRIAR